MDRKTVDIRDHALYNIGYDQVAVQYLSGRINYCSGGKSPQLKRRKTMAEKKNPVPTGGQMDIYRLGIICMAAILHYRILKRHIRNFFRKQNRGMGLPCRILGECLQMVYDGTQIWLWHRNGMGKL